MKNLKSVFAIVVGALFVVCCAAVPAWANPKQIKAYKEAYPGTKPKCVNCHADEKPKKDDGLHNPNEYGKKVLALNATPDADTYKKAGPGPAAPAAE